MRIESAVTTCIRNGADYLPSTLKSLRDAGFDPRTVTDRERTGSWPTLREALRRLMLTSGEALAVFQDDIRIAMGCREWLEGQLWPAPIETIGVVSLYTASLNHLRAGWFHAGELAVYRPWGGCALVFPRHAAQKVLDYKERAMLTGSDTTTATVMRAANLSWWMHSPSLVEHVGEVSSIAVLEIGLNEHRIARNWISDVSQLPPRAPSAMGQQSGM